MQIDLGQLHQVLTGSQVPDVQNCGVQGPQAMHKAQSSIRLQPDMCGALQLLIGERRMCTSMPIVRLRAVCPVTTGILWRTRPTSGAGMPSRYAITFHVRLEVGVVSQPSCGLGAPMPLLSISAMYLDACQGPSMSACPCQDSLPRSLRILLALLKR